MSATRPRPRWEATHQRIREAAANLIRHRGLSAPSVADVMNAVGHTVGGFYAHWPNRAALFAEAFSDRTRALWHKLLGTATQTDPKQRAVWIVRQYLSRTHRDADIEGCLFPSVLEDAAAHGEPYRTAVAAELEAFAEGLAQNIAPNDAGGRKQALGLLSLLLGGVALARATGTSPLSTEILEASRALAYAALDVQPSKLAVEAKPPARGRARS
jgi:TetR/AcrR family transcriptional repressor of nem operon